jgi:hypothetical protein
MHAKGSPIYQNDRPRVSGLRQPLEDGKMKF